MFDRILNFIQCRRNELNLWLLGVTIRAYVKQPEVIYDIGAGNRPQQFLKPTLAYVLFDPQFDLTCETPREGEVFTYKRKGTWKDAISDMAKIFPWLPNAVFLMDVIEHLDKAEARYLLEETKKVADQIVIFTPLGFMQQHDGEFNTHRSGWYPLDFNTEGWHVWILHHFHTVDFKGQNLSKPRDALLAIWQCGGGAR